jgi:hypothetical protein
MSGSDIAVVAGSVLAIAALGWVPPVTQDRSPTVLYPRTMRARTVMTRLSIGSHQLGRALAFMASTGIVHFTTSKPLRPLLSRLHHGSGAPYGCVWTSPHDHQIAMATLDVQQASSVRRQRPATTIVDVQKCTCRDPEHLQNLTRSARHARAEV